MQSSLRSKLLLFLVPLFFCSTVLLTNAAVQAPTKQATKIYHRIISLYPAHTENLVSLGAEKQLIGISKSDDYPESIINKPRFSSRDDPERFLAAKPDLILIRPMIERAHPQLLAKLREAGIDIISLQPNSVKEIFSYWRELASLCGKKKQGEQMIADFQARLAAVNKRIATIPEEQRQHIYFESIHRKMKTFATTSIAMFALEQAGGINVATDAKQVRKTNIAAYSKERILAHANDIDVYVAQKGRMNPVTLDMITNETGFSAIKAVRNNRIILIREELVSRPTMRLIEGIETLQNDLYPELKKGTNP